MRKELDCRKERIIKMEEGRNGVLAGLNILVNTQSDLDKVYDLAEEYGYGWRDDRELRAALGDLLNSKRDWGLIVCFDYRKSDRKKLSMFNLSTHKEYLAVKEGYHLSVLELNTFGEPESLELFFKITYGL